MKNLTLNTDVRIAKLRRAHVLLDEHEQIIGWYQTVVEGLAKAADLGETEILIRDGEFAFFLNFTKLEGPNEN